MRKNRAANIICFVFAVACLIGIPVAVFMYLPAVLIILPLLFIFLWFSSDLIAGITEKIFKKGKHEDKAENRVLDKGDSEGGDAEANVYDSHAQSRERGSFEDEIEDILDNLDMITTSAMAIMLSDTKARASSKFIKDMAKPDVNDVLLEFLRETYDATDIGQINRLFSEAYYKRKIRKHLRGVIVFVKRGISYSLPKKNMWLFSRMRVSRKQTNAYIDKICQTINSFESVKYIPALSGGKKISEAESNYKLDHLNDTYKDALIYLVDILLTCTCISKMLFVERMISKLPADSEFVRIIENFALTVDNHNLIINKSRPIYKQFYQAELGNISGDHLLYGMAITIMVNFIRKTDIMNKDIYKLEFTPTNAGELNNNMMRWLDILAKYDYAADPGALILQRIALLIKGNCYLLLDALGELLTWEGFYNSRVAYYKRERDKERYLKGDLNKEILEMSDYRE